MYQIVCHVAVIDLKGNLNQVKDINREGRNNVGRPSIFGEIVGGGDGEIILLYLKVN